MDRLEEKLLVFIQEKEPISWVDVVKHFIAEYSLRQLEDAADWLLKKAYVQNDGRWADRWGLPQTAKAIQVAQLLKTLKNDT